MRVLFTFVTAVTAVSLVTNEAFAVDKAACAAAAESGQQLKNDGKFVEAREQFLICARADCPPAVTQDCVKWLGETEKNIGSLKVNAPQGARVVIDGIERQPLSVDLDPGKHTVRTEQAGFTASESTVELAPGERRELDVKLSPLPVVVAEPPKPKPSSGGFSIPAVSWILAGVGVLGGAGFAVFGVMGMNDQDALRKNCAPFCTASQVGSVSTKFAVADTSLVVGLAALTTAVILAIVWPRAPQTAFRPMLLY